MKIILTESQLNHIIITEEEKNQKLFDKLRLLAMAGLMSIAGVMEKQDLLTMQQKNELVSIIQNNNRKIDYDTSDNNNINYSSQQKQEKSEWKLLTTHCRATVFNAVSDQTDDTPLTTASGFKINPKHPEKHRIIAIERTMRQKYGIKFGDVIKVEGAGQYDGVWQIQDLMNSRFEGQDKIDFLVPSNVKHGSWKNLKIYKLNDKSKTKDYLKKFEPSL